MSKGTATHKQIKKLNEKAKTRKALEDVQRIAHPVRTEFDASIQKSTRKKLKEVKFTINTFDPSWPGFNHFCNKRKKGLGKKYKSLI